MHFVRPMLASPWRDLDIQPGQFAAEEKFDGERMCINVASTGGNLFGDPTVIAWSRNAIERHLPPQIGTVLEQFPSGVYDGELMVPGKRSFGVKTLENADKLVLVIFDVTELLGKDVTGHSYDQRRALLAEIFKKLQPTSHVVLAESREVSSLGQVQAMTLEVWARDGEGLIIKRRSSMYSPGKRPKDWFKIKQLRSASLVIVGYRSGKLGPHSTLLLRDDEGNLTTVKWKNLEELARLDAEPKKFIGRRLMIEYQERTPDGGYRHPRWDRWAEELE